MIEHLQFEWHLCQIHPIHLANRLVPSAASSSCFSLSAKYNLAMPGISGLSAVMRIFIHSVLERDTSSSSVIFADILVPTQAIKVHMHCHNLRSESPNFNSFNIVSTDWHWLLLLVTCVRDASQHDPTPSNPLPNVQTQILI